MLANKMKYYKHFEGGMIDSQPLWNVDSLEEAREICKENNNKEIVFKKVDKIIDDNNNEYEL